MNDFTKEDILFGSTIVPESYCELFTVPLTKKEKRKIFIYKIKEITIEVLWFLLLMLGITLQINGIAHLAKIFF